MVKKTFEKKMKLNFLSKQYKKDSKLKISHNYLKEQFSDYSKIFKEITKVVKRGDYTLGSAVNECEKNFAKRTGAKYAIGVGNGTDALFLTLKAFNIGKNDEVITTPFTFVSTTASIVTAGAKPIFARIAAMPVLNKYAKEWAEANGAKFVPLGLKHELVTACAVRVVENIREEHGDPGHVWFAISTGVLGRSLQIGWNNSQHHAVAVARNLKAGELGGASVDSDPLAFTRNEKKHNMPPFPTVGNYDAKVWKYIPKNQRDENHWMWNVGKEPILENPDLPDRVDSYRDWGDLRWKETSP